uniref:Uncharacterized protein n=1 Tax=Glossina palpalis gambiensis TaxID=67801 RepID=A0A1B0AWU5_9MUSC
MLKRSKSSRRNHRSSNVVTKLLQQQRLDLNEDNNRCSDGDSSQSSRTAVQPLFANVVHNASGHCGSRNADGVLLVSKSLNSEPKISRIPTQQVNMPQQMQQQQRQQQQQQQQHQQQKKQQQRTALTTVNQISRSATTCLNDIYERNSLNQTTFMAIEDKQRLTQGQQIHHQGKQVAKPSHPMWQQKHHKPTHFLKLPAPPPLLPLTHQPIGAGYPHYFQFSEPYTEPMDSKNHFLNEPPPPAPLNHVYETIKERSPISPPPPDRLQAINNTLPPPLPPSRLIKKKIIQASSNQSRSHKTHRKSSTEKEAEKKGYSKMFASQPPAYTAPPALVIGSVAGSTAVANGANNTTNVRYQRPSALPIVLEEEAGEFQDVLVLEEDGTAKLPYRHGKIEVSLETAQAMAAAAYYASNSEGDVQDYLGARLLTKKIQLFRAMIHKTLLETDFAMEPIFYLQVTTTLDMSSLMDPCLIEDLFVCNVSCGIL